jgi:hypothetical protein
MCINLYFSKITWTGLAMHTGTTGTSSSVNFDRQRKEQQLCGVTGTHGYGIWDVWFSSFNHGSELN